MDLPPSLDELGSGFVAEFVDALDVKGWAEIGVDKYGDPMGAPSYHPRGLLGVWLDDRGEVQPEAGGRLGDLWMGCQHYHVTLWTMGMG